MVVFRAIRVILGAVLRFYVIWVNDLAILLKNTRSEGFAIIGRLIPYSLLYTQAAAYFTKP